MFDQEMEDKDASKLLPSHFEAPYRFLAFPTTRFRVNSDGEMVEAIAQNAQQQEEECGEGWSDTPDEATSYQSSLDDSVSDAAAEKSSGDTKMSSKARIEAKLKDDSTGAHVPE